MNVIVKRVSDSSLMQRACEMTMKGKASKMTLRKIYECEHSPIRCCLFWVEMLNIPTFVSVHLVRHSIGVTHYVESNRDDRGGVQADRMTPVNHGMLLNAQTLINMARKRLCTNAHEETRKVMGLIKEEVGKIDPDLASFMVRDCEYRGKCCELKRCGYFENCKAK